MTPLAKSLEDYLGNYSISAADVGEHGCAREARRLHPGEPRDLRDGYHVADCQLHPTLAAHKARVRRMRGPVLALIFEGRVVGFVKHALMWIAPEHRGKGLGVELMVERQRRRLEMVQDEGWTWRGKKAKHRSFSEAGLETRKRAYRVLVERGIYVEP